MRNKKGNRQLTRPVRASIDSIGIDVTITYYR